VLTIFVTARGRERARERFAFAEPEVTIGRVKGNHVVLPDTNVSRRHARIVVRDDRIILTDLKSTNGTYVNGRKCTAPAVVQEHDKIYIGDFILVFEIERAPTRARPPFLPRDRREADLLRAINENDEPSREVYADWLEEHGHPREADFVRAQQALVAVTPDDVAFRALTQRLSQLAEAVDPRWRLRVARPAIENCEREDVPRFSFKCPKEWGGLAATARHDIKFCTACEKNVYYCASVPEARDRAARGECVALDSRAVRWRSDLGKPYGRRSCRSCHSDLGTFDGNDCPRCGAEQYSMTVGMIG
jgi:uncharacterized protein (TIGR02996 family)